MNILGIILLVYFIAATIYGAIYLAKSRTDGNEYTLFDIFGNILPGMMMVFIIPFELASRVKFKKKKNYGQNNLEI